MRLPIVIDTGQARQYIALENQANITEWQAAMLEVWRFYRRPTKRYEFILTQPYKYALTCYGDRLGIVKQTKSGIYIFSDVGIDYYATKAKIRFEHGGNVAKVRAVAHNRHWHDIESKNF